MRILCCYVLLLAVLAAPVSAQVGLAGEIGFTYKQDFARREGEASTRVNSTIKGASPFSLVRARFFVDAEVDDGVAVFTTLLFDEDLQSFDLEGAYVVFDEVAGVSWASALVGKMPTAFGTFAARSFAMVNPLIGVPLIYHYFTAIQGGSVARDNAAQLARRGDGFQPGRGLSILYDSCWNSGVQLFGSYNQLTYALALTKGAVSNPTATDNDGIQLVGRVGAQPTMGLKFGFSLALAPYLNERVASNSAFPQGARVEDYLQRLVGFDLEYSRGHFQLIAEAVRNEWQVPNLTIDALANTGAYVEGKYELGPGFYYALRYGFIDFDAIADGVGGRRDWDFDTRRVETGFGYYLSRQTRVKALLQLNSWAKEALDRHDRLFALELASAF
ncbi:MAG: hypothetical protein ACI906_004063 [Candidatus Latescibacterota bacterium]|jgi:hypothetical protein